MQQPADTIVFTRHPPDSSSTPGSNPGVLEEFFLLVHELRATAHTQVRLAALETRHAGESLVGIVALGVIAGGLVFSAWLALVGAMMMALVEHGIATISVAAILVMSANALMAVVLIMAIRMKSRRLLLSATVNSLAPPAPPASNQRTSA